MERDYTAEIGHELGWDLARFGWDLRTDSKPDVIEGHKAGAAHFAGVAYGKALQSMAGGENLSARMIRNL